MTLADYRTWAATPLDGRPELSVVIPTYNEEWRILPTIGAIATHVSSMGMPWELIIADDGSTDSTLQLVSDLGLVNLKALKAEANGGKGSAVRRGIKAARGSYILFADADQSTPIEQLDTLLAPVRTGEVDITIGSRAAVGADVQSKSMLRKVLSAGLNQLVRTVFPIDIQDTQCGFKLFSQHAASTLFDRTLIDGFSFDLEVLYLAHKCGFEVREIPVEWLDAPGSTVDPGRVALGFLRDLALIRRNDLAGKYGKLSAELASPKPKSRFLRGGAEPKPLPTPETATDALAAANPANTGDQSATGKPSTHQSGTHQSDTEQTADDLTINL